MSRKAVVDTGATLVDRDGFEQLTMASLAKELGIALPSLYAHVRSLEHLRQQIAALATGELGLRMSEAIEGRARSEALFELGRAYRAYALQHPGRYVASFTAVDTTDPEQLEAGMRCIRCITAVMRGYELVEAAATDAARFLRSSLHGFVSIERIEGFAHPRSREGSFEALLLALDRALSTWPSDSKPVATGATRTKSKKSSR
ncbi:Transcriptional regulator, TetR family [Labilithrix luteola]|uniref:Transcriptional regulator, TetR family n=1 Tax=Labilithrix luteola TaxID=1391654 RepID=A0A0K1Q1D9_9BACT|nr:Transcriptional regulator, TetR family [Labilithrix luteola]